MGEGKKERGEGWVGEGQKNQGGVGGVDDDVIEKIKNNKK